MSSTEVKISAEYARSYGQHDFVAAEDRTVSVISEPDWKNFFARLSNADSLGDVVLTPELITSPGAIEEIPAKRPVIEERIEAVREVSQRYAGTVIVLGTATFNGHPANSQLFIKGGEIIGQVNKGFSYHQAEKSQFKLGEMPNGGGTGLGSGIAGLICADLVAEARTLLQFPVAGSTKSDGLEYRPKTGLDTKTVLLSSCWAVPAVNDRLIDGFWTNPEERFRPQLENSVALLFRMRPALQEVIVADRVPPMSDLSGPLNARFTTL